MSELVQWIAIIALMPMSLLGFLSAIDRALDLWERELLRLLDESDSVSVRGLDIVKSSRFKRGTVYVFLNRLERQGCARSWLDKEGRRVYMITPRGMERLGHD